MPSRPVTLVTNDDGIDSAGLRALASAAVVAGLDVVVAAPMTDASGASASIQHRRTPEHTVAVDRVTLPGFDARCYAVDGNPGFIALTGARGAFGETPDVVLSGINRGWNTGHVVLHSGTVGAALSAALHGCRTMAVSLGWADEMHWPTAAYAASKLLPFLRSCPRGTALNVNVPNVPVDAITGVRWARLAPFGTVHTLVAELGEEHLEISVDEPLTDVPPDTDAALVAAGFVTVTALRAMTELDLDAGLPPLD